ncbi:MAG: peptidoglycan DD-metalloendopeptidase family protein [Lachnospiraceae bacterium]|nr:peptidoglycan DD-metalloendopeptidase family protein [Lachnospiraceae bacterium]
MKALRRKKLFLLSFMMVGVMAISAVNTIAALEVQAATSDSIKQKEDEIAQKKKEKEQMQSGLSDVKKIKQSLEKEKKNLQSYVKQLDANLTQIEGKIMSLQLQIAQKEEEIRITEAQLEEALQRENDQKNSVVACIKLIHESGRPDLLHLFLKSSGFGDFLNNADYAEKVVEYDHRIWQEYKAAREYTELCKQDLELQKEILDTAKKNVEIEQQNVEELIDEKAKEINKYESDIKDKDKLIREYEEEIAAQTAEIEALEKAVLKEILGVSELVYDGGKFVFPLKSYTRVSSDYGNRIHPTLHVKQFHNGVDFAAPKGTPIYAAYNGIVVAAAYSSTMGNYVMINHGSELYTIYMHASVLHVKTGDVVVKGETIAGVGTTGRSTGNHLHFTVRLNGNYKSPWDYIDKK